MRNSIYREYPYVEKFERQSNVMENKRTPPARQLHWVSYQQLGIRAAAHHGHSKRTQKLHFHARAQCISLAWVNNLLAISLHNKQIQLTVPFRVCKESPIRNLTPTELSITKHWQGSSETQLIKKKKRQGKFEKKIGENKSSADNSTPFSHNKALSQSLLYLDIVVF